MNFKGDTSLPRVSFEIHRSARDLSESAPAKGVLPEHFVLQVADQSGGHFLELRNLCEALGKEDHRASGLVLLHPLPRVLVPHKSGLA